MGLFDSDVDVDLSGSLSVPVSGSLNLTGIPDAYSLDITHVPKIELSLDPITINPLDLSLRLKEIPSVRGHLPANFTVALSILGFQLLCVRLCGEAQLITEPYTPNPCEKCEEGVPPPVPPVQRKRGTVLS